MSEPTFTSGPWQIKAASEYGFAYDVEGVKQEATVALIFPPAQWLADSERAAESQANAALIAAAPEMYAALEMFAEGRTNLSDFSCHRGICSAAECGRCSRVLAARAALAKARGGR